MRGLYAIIDLETLAQRELELGRVARAMLEAKPVALQLRDKRRDARATLEALLALRACTPAEVLLIANDRADLAKLAECDGVHVGRQDLPAQAARAVLGRAGAPTPVIGTSVHSEGELDQALGEQPDYLAFGPVFPTASKANPEPTIGLDGLRQLVELARARAPELPRVAIGGISIANASSVAAWCPCAAVIGGLLPTEPSGDPYDAIATRAVTLHRLLTS